MSAQHSKEQIFQDDHYSNLSPKEKPGDSPSDAVRNPEFQFNPKEERDRLKKQSSLAAMRE